MWQDEKENLLSRWETKTSKLAPSLCFKARLIAKLLIWKWFFILLRFKPIFTRKILHQALFWKWEFLKLGNGVMKSYSLQWRDNGKEMYKNFDARAELLFY